MKLQNIKIGGIYKWSGMIGRIIGQNSTFYYIIKGINKNSIPNNFVDYRDIKGAKIEEIQKFLEQEFNNNKEKIIKFK